MTIDYNALIEKARSTGASIKDILASVEASLKKDISSSAARTWVRNTMANASQVFDTSSVPSLKNVASIAIASQYPAHTNWTIEDMNSAVQMLTEYMHLLVKCIGVSDKELAKIIVDELDQLLHDCDSVTPVSAPTPTPKKTEMSPSEILRAWKANL